MPQNPREPSHTRRSGYLPGVSKQVKTAKAPHEMPVGQPVAPRTQPVIHHPGQGPEHGGAKPPHKTKQEATVEIGDFALAMAGFSVGAGAVAGVSEAPLNLLDNGGFEVDTASPPFNWSTTNSATLQATVATLSSQLTEGQNYAVLTIPTGQTSTVISSTVPIDPLVVGPVLLGQMDMNPVTAGSGILQMSMQHFITFYDVNGSQISQVAGNVMTMAPAMFGSGYVSPPMQVTALVPSNAYLVNFAMSISLMAAGGSNTVIDIDNCILTPGNLFNGYHIGTALTQTPFWGTNDLATTAYVDTEARPKVIVKQATNGTLDAWTNLATGYVKMTVILVGAGGGGGAGRNGSSAATGGGGGGGGAGNVVMQTWTRDTFGDFGTGILQIVCGKGSTGSPGVTSAGNGGSASAGGESLFQGFGGGFVYLRASGGSGGGGGTTSGGVGGTGGFNTVNQAAGQSFEGFGTASGLAPAGGGAGGTTAAATVGADAFGGPLPSGGGGGGGTDTVPGGHNGGNSGRPGWSAGAPSGNAALGGTGGHGASGANGYTTSASLGMPPWHGGGGGGGGSGAVAADAGGGNGGNGASPGGGGGGGGAMITSGAKPSGKGGNGADGYAIIIYEF